MGCVVSTSHVGYLWGAFCSVVTLQTTISFTNQALEKVEGQPAWRVRHLLSLALCQSSVSEEGGSKAEAEVSKTLSKALDLATAAGLQRLRVSVGCAL